MANVRHMWSGHRSSGPDRGSAKENAAESPIAPATPAAPGPAGALPVVGSIDGYILAALNGPAGPPGGRRAVPTLKPEHGRWWDVALAIVGYDIVLRITRPRGDQGLVNQCLVSQGDNRWSHQAGNRLAMARGADQSLYSVRFPDDFEGPALASVGGSFEVTWSALYGADTWVLLNNTSFCTVYRGTLTC